MKKIYLKAGKEHIPNITYILDDIDIVEKEQVGPDMHYRKLITSVRDAERFNYRSDYWGSAEEYQDANVALMESIEDYVNKTVEITFEDEGPIKFKVLGLLIDKQYNSLSHTCLLVEEIS